MRADDRKDKRDDDRGRLQWMAWWALRPKPITAIVPTDPPARSSSGEPQPTNGDD